MSPKQFLLLTENYEGLSEQLRVKIIKDNIMLDFQANFSIIFNEQEFGFKADDKLISMVIASLEYVHIFDRNDSLIPVNQISRGIIFIQKGRVKVFHKKFKHQLLYFKKGSYIGEISYIF